MCMRRVDTAELIRVLKYLALRIMAVLVGRANAGGQKNREEVGAGAIFLLMRNSLHK